jgi:hypothetical protein
MLRNVKHLPGHRQADQKQKALRSKDYRSNNTFVRGEVQVHPLYSPRAYQSNSDFLGYLGKGGKVV